ncbi:MAG: hypothetical protein QM702_00050 [Rubrivivax sp.]
MTQPQAPSKPSPRDVMPNVARWIDGRRAEWGAEHVRECLKRGTAGEAGWFYAVENGMVQGTPFTADAVTQQVLSLGALVGARFVVAMRPPEAKRGA